MDITKLYKFDMFRPSPLPIVFVAHNDEVRNLWHERFGHINYHTLQNLCKENMVKGIPMESFLDGGCYRCVLKKHHQDHFEKCASWHASSSLQLMYSNLCGPRPTISFFGFKYFLTYMMITPCALGFTS